MAEMESDSLLKNMKQIILCDTKIFMKYGKQSSVTLFQIDIMTINRPEKLLSKFFGSEKRTVYY